jgi:CelD/BcsL family acetyltransferase involved in cellulose biosynthesis
VKASVTRPGEFGPDELRRWSALQQETAHLNSPFLSPGYAVALDRVRDDVRAAMLEDDGSVGFLGFQLRGRRTARPLGEGLSDCEGIVHTPGWKWHPPELLAACGLASWNFHNLVEEQVPAGLRGTKRSPTPVIDISAGYETYLAQRRRSSRSGVQTVFRKQRKMQRELGELRFEFADRNPRALQALMDWKSAQYHQTREWDRFAVPWIARLVWDLFDTSSAELGCAGNLSMLYIADRPVAGYLGLRSSATLACWFPAYDPELAPYSPGILLHFLMAEAAGDHGVTLLNLGRGDEGYKNGVKTGELFVVRGAVDDGSPRALAGRAARAPRQYLGPWIKGHPRLEQAALRTLNRLTPR